MAQIPLEEDKEQPRVVTSSMNPFDETFTVSGSLGQNNPISQEDQFNAADMAGVGTDPLSSGDPTAQPEVGESLEEWERDRDLLMAQQGLSPEQAEFALIRNGRQKPAQGAVDMPNPIAGEDFAVGPQTADLGAQPGGQYDLGAAVNELVPDPDTAYIQSYTDEEAKIEAAKQKSIQKAMGEAERIEREKAAEEAEDQAKVDALVDDLQTQKIDPDRYWASRSTGTKVTALIGTMLMAYAGQGQAALNNLDAMVERDIRAQEADIKNKRSALSVKMSRLKDKRAAKLALKADAYEKAAREAEVLASRSRSNKVKFNGQQLVSQLKAKAEEKRIELKKKLYENVKMQRLNQGLNVSRDMYQSLDEKQKERLVPFTDSMGQQKMVYAPIGSKEEIRAAKTQVKDTGEAMKGIQALINLTESGGMEDVNLKERARAAVQTLAIKGKLRAAIIGPGNPSEYEQKLLNQLIANPTKVFGLNAVQKASLQTLMDNMASSQEATLRNIGIEYQPNSEAAIAAGLKPNQFMPEAAVYTGR